jgi:dihydrofolate reductase
MRKLIVSEFLTLDGVMQGPGAPDEDTDGGFKHGGWVVPRFDDGVGAYFGRATANADAVLLGRKTYVSHALAFEPNPAEDPFAGTTKYVVTKTLEKPLWSKTEFIRDNIVERIREIKALPGGDILTDGSCMLVQTMLEHDLVDEVNLLIFPVIVGGGKRIFPQGLLRSFKLLDATTTPNGIVIVRYQKAES